MLETINWCHRSYVQIIFTILVALVCLGGCNSLHLSQLPYKNGRAIIDDEKIVTFHDAVAYEISQGGCKYSAITVHSYEEHDTVSTLPSLSIEIIAKHFQIGNYECIVGFGDLESVGVGIKFNGSYYCVSEGDVTIFDASSKFVSGIFRFTKTHRAVISGFPFEGPIISGVFIARYPPRN